MRGGGEGKGKGQKQEKKRGVRSVITEEDEVSWGGVMGGGRWRKGYNGKYGVGGRKG